MTILAHSMSLRSTAPNAERARFAGAVISRAVASTAPAAESRAPGVAIEGAVSAGAVSSIDDGVDGVRYRHLMCQSESLSDSLKGSHPRCPL